MEEIRYGFITMGDWHVMGFRIPFFGLDDGVLELIQTKHRPPSPKPATTHPALLSKIGWFERVTGKEPANTLASFNFHSGAATQEEPWPGGICESTSWSGKILDNSIDRCLQPATWTSGAADPEQVSTLGCLGEADNGSRGGRPVSAQA